MLRLKKGEVKRLRFHIKDKDGNNVDCSSAIFEFGLKHSKEDASYAFHKENADFDKTEAADGIVSLVLDTSSIDSGDYIGELKIVFGANNVEISDDIALRIEPSVF